MIDAETSTSAAQRQARRGPPTRQKLGSANSAVNRAAPSRAWLVGHLKISGSSTSSATNSAQAWKPKYQARWPASRKYSGSMMLTSAPATTIPVKRKYSAPPDHCSTTNGRLKKKASW